MQQLPESSNYTLSSPSYTPMFNLHDNSYTSSTGRGSITRSDSFNRVPGSPGIAASYPDVGSMVAWSETPHDLRNTTDAAYRDASQDDRLWMLSCVRKISSLLIFAEHSFKFRFIPLQFSLSKSQHAFISLPFPSFHNLTNISRQETQDDIRINPQKRCHTSKGQDMSS